MPGQLTLIPAGPTFQLDCMDGFSCRESTTIRFRHLDCPYIRGGQFSLLLLATSFFLNYPSRYQCLDRQSGTVQ
jgi:hypothetical protein